MSFYQNWKSPEPSLVIDVLDAINRQGVMPPLGVFSSVLRCQPLDFYDTGMLFEAVYTRESPNLRRFFMINDENVVYLDGTVQSVQKCNRLYSLWLETTNVMSYILFYTIFAVPKENKNRLMLTMDDITSDMVKKHPGLCSAIVVPQVQNNGENYSVDVSYWDGDMLQKTQIIVALDGRIYCNGPDMFA